MPLFFVKYAFVSIKNEQFSQKERNKECQNIVQISHISRCKLFAVCYDIFTNDHAWLQRSCYNKNKTDNVM